MKERLASITTIAQKRGFFAPTAQIYGGEAGFWTYGHLGKALKNRFEQFWRNYFLQDNSYEIESSTILPEAVFKASGHLEHFNDPLTECQSCHFRFRADQFIEDKLNISAEGLSAEAMTKLIQDNKLRCPKCKGTLSKVRWWNMMFPVNLGFDKAAGYLSPETAQAAYLAFKQEFETTRKKLPLGIAIIGKAFRNEISPRQIFFRLREFTQAELQIFFDPDEIDKAPNWAKIARYKLRLLPVKARKAGKIAELSCEAARKQLRLPKFYLYHMALVQRFYLEQLKIPKESFRFKELSKDERAFYNKIHWDIELLLPTLGGFREVSGIHYRTDYDLSRHQQHSKQKLEIFYNNKRFIPHVLELSFGIDRNMWGLLDIFYKEEKERTLFNFPPAIAPLDVAVFPLVNKDSLPKKAQQIYKILKEHFVAFYDDSGSIGRRYRRVDEIGCPAAITVDYDTLKRNDVTLRARDTMKQKRIKITKLQVELNKILKI